MAEETPSVGSRVEIDGYFATVRFVGEVPPTKGIWLGVEWDDPSRGKHNGTHEGKHYFNTRHPTSGSFIRQKKVNIGVEFLSALKDRYGRIEDENAGIIQEDMFVRGYGNKQTMVEVVGAKSVNLKQSNFEHLTEVGLRGQLVSSAGKGGHIKQVCPNIQELDISLNLLSSWHQVASITSQLCKLNTLDVSSNKLSIPEDPHSLADSFSTLKILYLNRMEYSWKQVYECGLMWPGLHQLHVCFNAITSISNPLPNLQHLQVLNLEGNPIQHWANILQLGSLSSLQTLILNDTQLNSIEFPDCQPGTDTSAFPKLQCLSLDSNNISEWRHVNELNKLKCLRDLKMRYNPVTSVSQRDQVVAIRYLIIAKIARLQSFNRSAIEADERKGAEVDYLKLFGLDWKAAGGDQDPEKNAPNSDFIRLHPRYQQLINKYGPPEDSELKKQSSALKNNLISLNIDCPSLPEKLAISKKLPRTMTVQKLRALLARLYKMNSDEIIITYTSKKMESQGIELDNDLREIGFYSIEDGDSLHVC